MSGFGGGMGAGGGKDELENLKQKLNELKLPEEAKKIVE
jgi:hypothetical protein